MKIILDNETLELVKNNEARCIDCKKCYNTCKMMKEHSSSPKRLMKDIINEGKVDKDIPYSCMLCGACDNKCPKDIDIDGMFYSLRKAVFKDTNNKAVLKNIGYRAVKFHQINSFSPIFSSKGISKQNSNTTRNNPNTDEKVMFLPGCSLASYSDKLIQDTFDYLKQNINNVFLGMKCCGKPTYSMGNIDKFNMYYSDLEKLYEKENITEVIVACANCFDTIKKNSKNIKVTSLWEVISEYGIPNNLRNHYSDFENSYTLHDPCPMRNESKIHDDVRKILIDLGINIIEYDLNKEHSECCGSGAMVRLTSPNISQAQTNKRANDAKADVVITYCQSCCESMMIGNKKTLHMLDLIFNEDVINKKTITQRPTSTSYKWKMRYASKKLVKE